MLSNQEDPVKTRIIEAELALEPVNSLLEVAQEDLKAGQRSKAEAFIANAPTLWGYERDTERLFLALDIAISAIQADPTFGGGYAMAAACLYRLGARDTDLYDARALIVSIPWANRAIAVDPEYDGGWETYIEIHCYKGDFKTAESALGRVLKRFGDGDLYARCAFLYFRLQGDMPQAKNWGALAWQTEWDSARLVRTLFALGQIYREAKEWPKGLDCYRVITEKDHQNAWAWHYFALCTAMAGDAVRALELNQKAVALGQRHEFRAYQEELRRMAGRQKLVAPRTATVATAPPPVRMKPPAGAHTATGIKTVATPPVVKALPRKSATAVLPQKKVDTTKQVRIPPPPRRRPQG